MSRKLKKLRKIIPDLAENVVEVLNGDESFNDGLRDVAEDVCSLVIDQHDAQKTEHKKKRLFSLADISTLGKILEIKNAATIDQKFAAAALPFITYDYVNTCFRMQATHKGFGILHPVNIIIGARIDRIEHRGDATFDIETDTATIIYNHNGNEIMDFSLK